MAKRYFGVLSLGAFLIILAIWIAALLLAAITTSDLVPLILLSSGIWIIIVAGIKTAKHEGDSFSTFSWGMLFIVLGGSLFMVNKGMEILYTVVFILLLIGALAVVAALKIIRK